MVTDDVAPLCVLYLDPFSLIHFTQAKYLQKQFDDANGQLKDIVCLLLSRPWMRYRRLTMRCAHSNSPVPKPTSGMKHESTKPKKISQK